MKDKLAEKFPPAEVDAAMARLKALKFLDDPMFVRQFSESALSGKRKGLRYIQWTLQQKGVPTELIREVLEQGRDGEREAAVAVARRLKARGKERRNIAGALVRRGFTNSAIAHALQSLNISGGDADATDPDHDP